MALSVTSEFRELSDRLCREAGFSPAVAFEAVDVATVRALVGAGLGQWVIAQVDELELGVAAALGLYPG